MTYPCAVCSVTHKNEDILQASMTRGWYNWQEKEVRPVKKEIRTVVYDDELRIEAYRFEGILQPFPNHFHAYYVIGFVEDGERVLLCKNQEYTITKGDVLLFNPGDNHACVQSDGGTLDYRGFNITKEVMLDLAEEVTGRRELLSGLSSCSTQHQKSKGRGAFPARGFL